MVKPRPLRFMTPNIPRRIQSSKTPIHNPQKFRHIGCSRATAGPSSTRSWWPFPSPPWAPSPSRPPSSAPSAPFASSSSSARWSRCDPPPRTVRACQSHAPFTPQGLPSLMVIKPLSNPEHGGPDRCANTWPRYGDPDRCAGNLINAARV
jgi:hypothetical protein